jgi:UDP-galactopyranose mutase
MHLQKEVKNKFPAFTFLFDYLIIGSGLFGAVFARQMTDKGFKCLVLEKRGHLGGNIYTENIEGINVHKYGPHIFHTNDKDIWDYVNRFSTFNNYRHRVLVKNKDRLFSFPINLLTLYQLWGISSPAEADAKLKLIARQEKNMSNLEDWALSQVGPELYELFIKGYTEKQWGRSPIDLPASIIKRIPIRNTFNDFYFDDLYQGIPIGGYTKLVEKLLEGIEVKLNVDYLLNKDQFNDTFRNLVFTGAIDEFFEYYFGALEYRSIRFEETVIDQPDYQGISVVNFTESCVPFTRILEHKHFEFLESSTTVITKEFPLEWKKGIEPFYPVNDDRNNKLYNQYRDLAKNRFPNVIFGGRLAEYKYYDMHQVIASALSKSKGIAEQPSS